MSKQLWRFEEGKLRLSLHPGQAQAWRSKARFVAIIAGTQSGKTSFSPWWLWREIQHCGPGDYIAATSTFDLFKLKFLPSMREVFEHTLKCGRYWAGSKVMELAHPEKGFLGQNADDPAMWGRIILRSASSGGGLESATAKAAVLDEAGQDEFTVETWEAVLRRLSLSQGRVLLPTTPYNLGWLKTEVYDRWVDGDPNFEVVQFKSTHNPIFPQAEYERAKATMSDWRFRMMYEGQFTRPAGMIYEMFDEAIHVCADFTVPKGWPQYLCVDFGGQNTAKLWIAEDPDTDRFFVIREELSGGMSTRQHVQSALSHGRPVAAWGGAPSEDQPRWDWTAEGLEVQRPPVSDVESGIARVVELLQTKRLQVFRSCRGLLDEFGSYRRKLGKDGQPIEEIEDKRKYHRLDAVRYGASALVNPLMEVEWRAF